MPSRSRQRSRGRSRHRHRHDDGRSRSHSRSRSRSDSSYSSDRSRSRSRSRHRHPAYTVLQHERVEEVLLDKKGRRTGMRKRDIVTLLPASQVSGLLDYSKQSGQKQIEYRHDEPIPIRPPSPPTREQRYPSCYANGSSPYHYAGSSHMDEYPILPIRPAERREPEGTGSKLKRFFGCRKGDKEKPGFDFGRQYGDMAVPYNYYNSAHEESADRGGRYY